MKKYQSIVRSDNKRTIDYLREQNLLGGQWYATEKTHGCNFSIISDGVRFASREKDVTNESFHGYREVIGDLAEKVCAMAEKLSAKIQVYFEFYGGSIIDTKCKRITYHEGNPKQFIALDILNLDTNEFLDYPANYELLQEFGIPVAPVIATGTFDELIQINPAIKSVVATLANVDAEGVVLKPFKYTAIPETGERVLIKCISPLFEENKAPIAAVKEMADDSDKIKSVATMERLGKVAAKIGITSQDKAKTGALIVALKTDIKDEIGTVNEKQLTEAAVSLVKTFFA